MNAAAILAVILVAGCGGAPKVKAKPRPVAVKPPPPPPPVCIKGGDAMGAIGSANGGEGGAEFCVSDGAESNECFSVDLASRKYERMTARPTGQPASLAPSPVTVETTPTEVRVCNGEDCKTIAPRVVATDNQLVAVANEAIAVVMIGDTDAGKGVAEVWDVAKVKKLATIKYAKGDFKCGTPKLLGSTVFISASVCAGPAARGGLYNARGKRIADAGSKEFGTYSEVAIQVKDDLWALLEENAALVVLQDVATGKVQKAIPLAALWVEGDAPTDTDLPPMGNPGETALVRGGNGKVLVISGSPSPGNVGVIDVATGEIDVLRAPLCAPEAEPAANPVVDDDAPPMR